MGKKVLTIENSDFTYFLSDTSNGFSNVQAQASFNENSLSVANIVYDDVNKTLFFDTTGAGTNFETVSSSNVTRAQINMLVSNAVPVNAVVIGKNTTGNFLVYYLNGSGDIRVFNADGSVGAVVNNTAFPQITIPKGDQYIIQRLSDRFVITHNSIIKEVPFSLLTDLDTPVIGVLGTGGGLVGYDFSALAVE